MKKFYVQGLNLLIFAVFFMQGCFINPLDLIHQEIGKAIDPLVPQLVKSNKSTKKLTLAVIGFKEIHSGRPLNVSDIIEEELATKLVPLPNFNIVEHRKISEIEAELVKQTGLIYDDETTREVGKLVGADAILTGTIDVQDSKVTVYARIVDIQQGFVLSSATINISKIGLPERTWLPSTRLSKPVHPRGSSSDSEEPLPASMTFGVTPYLSKEKLQKTFLPILNHLENETGISMKLVVVSNYSNLSERMKIKDIDIGVFSPFAYVEGVKQAGVKIFASQLINNRQSYQGYIITQNDSSIKRLSDLKDKSFAFVDPKSTSGYIYPRVMLIEQGYNPATFFKNTFFSGSHDKSLQAVLNGTCDSSAVYEDIIDQKTLGKIRIIAKTDKIPYDAYTVRRGVAGHVVKKIQKALISLDRNSETGQKVFTGKINGFTIGRDKNYDVVRKMASFRADRPNIAILNFKEIGSHKVPMSETACELLKNELFLKNNFNLITPMESPALSALIASGNRHLISEELLNGLEKEGVQLVVSGSVIHMGSKINLSVKLHNVPSGAIKSAFTTSDKPQNIENMISTIINEINEATPIEGYVITVEDKSFITDFGSDNGISENDKIIVYQEGKPLINPLTGIVLGKKEEILAEGIVISTTSKVSVCKVISGKFSEVKFGKRARTLMKNETVYVTN